MIRKGIINLNDNQIVSFGTPMHIGPPTYKPQKLTEMEAKDVNKKLNGYEVIRKKVLDESYSVSKSDNTNTNTKKQKINIGL